MVNYMLKVINLLVLFFQVLKFNVQKKFNMLVKFHVLVEMTAPKNVFQVQVLMVKKFMQAMLNLFRQKVMDVMMKKMVENLVMLFQLTLLLGYQNWGEKSKTLRYLKEKMGDSVKIKKTWGEAEQKMERADGRSHRSLEDSECHLV
jgi:hypothetical protein